MTLFEKMRDWRMRAASRPQSRIHNASDADLLEFARLARADAYERAILNACAATPNGEVSMRVRAAIEALAAAEKETK